MESVETALVPEEKQALEYYAGFVLGPRQVKD